MHPLAELLGVAPVLGALVRAAALLAGESGLLAGRLLLWGDVPLLLLSLLTGLLGLGLLHLALWLLHPLCLTGPLLALAGPLLGLGLLHPLLGLRLLHPLALRLLLALSGLLGLLALLGRLLRLLTLLLAADELAALPACGHLVWVLGLAELRLELVRYLLGRHAGRALRTGLARLLLREADLLVNLLFLLFALLFLLRRLLDELPRLGVAVLEFGLDGLVLAERFAVAGVRGALVGAAALVALEALLLTLLLSLLCALLLTELVLVALVTHSLSGCVGRRSSHDPARPERYGPPGRGFGCYSRFRDQSA